MKIKTSFSVSAGLLILIGAVFYLGVNLKYAGEHAAKLTSVTIASARVNTVLGTNKDLGLNELKEILKKDGFGLKENDGALCVEQVPAGVVLYVEGMKELWTMKPMVIFAHPASRDGAELMDAGVFYSKILKN